MADDLKSQTKTIMKVVAALIFFIAIITIWFGYDQIQTSIFLAWFIVIATLGLSTVVLVEVSWTKIFQKARYTDGVSLMELLDIVTVFFAGLVFLLGIFTIPISIIANIAGVLPEAFMSFMRNTAGIVISIAGALFVFHAFKK